MGIFTHDVVLALWALAPIAIALELPPAWAGAWVGGIIDNTGAVVAAGPSLDPNLPSYAKVDGLRGTLNAAGSDTMLELQTLMAEEFRSIYPQVTINIEGKGSSTAPPALIEGTAQVGPMSRAMKAKELDDFEKAYGYKPTAIAVAARTSE